LIVSDVKNITLDFIKQPFPLWNCEIAGALTDNKLNALFGNAEEGRKKYSLSGCLLKDWEYSGLENVLPITQCGKTFSLITPTPHLGYFYEQHGLVPFTIEEFKASNAVDKLERTMAMFCGSPVVFQFLSQIVKSIQLIRSEDAETDVSYSHPDIPFTIFVSICGDDSLISSLRIAESILHESMHLLLTLIEGIFPLIDPTSKAVYYSPWRDEDRPVRGVLHGLFVFKAINDFYALLSPQITDAVSNAYILKRLDQIFGEMVLLKDFPLSPGLTEEGKQLAIKLV